MISIRKTSALVILAGIIPILLSLLKARTECYGCAMLALLYLLIYWHKIEVYKYMDSICGFFICFLTFVRYYIVPILIICDSAYMSYAPYGLSANSVFYDSGMLMTIWEMIFFSIFVSTQLPKWANEANCIDEFIEVRHGSAKLWIFIILLFTGMLMVSPSVLSDYSFVLDLKPDETIMEEYVHKSLTDTIAIIGSRVLKIILPIPFLCYFYRRYAITKSNSNFFFSLLILVFFYGLILEGNSRNSIIIPAVAAMFILLRFYPDNKKTILTVLISAIILITTLSVVWKSFANDYSDAKDSSLSYWISYIEVYFAGISNMGKAVYAYQTTDVLINPIIAFNDLCRNVPFLNLLVDYSNTSSYYFTNVWGRTDQVIPATGNGLFYFGYIFAPCVSVLILKLAHKFEKFSYSSKSVPDYIISCYCCTVIAYNMFNSVSTMMMKLTITLVPLLLALYLSKKLSK